MIWNDRFLFLHYPKTAGKSLAEYFVESWEPPIYGITASGQRFELEQIRKDGLFIETGHSHQNAIAARTMLAKRGIDIRSFDAVFLTVRLPYELAYSSYCFLRANHASAPDRPNFALAANSTFAEFVERTRVSPYENWMDVDGDQLTNLRVIRFEHLREDLDAAARELRMRVADLGHLNATRRDSYEAHVTPELESILYDRYRVLFDRGWYERRSFGGTSSS